MNPDDEWEQIAAQLDYWPILTPNIGGSARNRNTRALERKLSIKLSSQRIDTGRMSGSGAMETKTKPKQKGG
jgi:hypothetical protein